MDRKDGRLSDRSKEVTVAGRVRPDGRSSRRSDRRPVIQSTANFEQQRQNGLAREVDRPGETGLGGERRRVGFVASTEDGLGHAIIEHRSQQTVYAVEDELPVPGKVVLAKVMPKQVVLDRLTTRRTCSNAACQAIYNVKSMPPKTEGICDKCGQPVIQRSDETEEAISKRLDVFNEQTAPLD